MALEAKAVSEPELQRAADAAVAGALQRSGIDLNLIPKRDELSRVLSALEEFKGSVVDDVSTRTAGTFDERFAAALGKDVLPRFEHIERMLKDADRRGNPISDRTPLTVGPEKARIYRQIGRAASVAAYRASGAQPPKEYEEFTRAQLAGTDTKGGVTIPELRVDDWVRIRPDHSIARKMIRAIPLDEELTMIVPTLASGLDADALTTEGTTDSPESDADFESEANSKVTAEVLSTFVKVSRKIPPRRFQVLEAFIGELLMEAVGVKEDKWFFNASSPFTGLLQAAGNTVTMDVGKTAFEDSNYTDWRKLQFAINPNLIGNGVYLMHPAVFGHVTGLLDGSNRPLFNTGWVTIPTQVPAAPVSDGPPAMVINRPCWLSTAMPDLSASAANTPFALYLDPSKALIGDSQDANVEVDDSQDRTKFMRRLYIFEVVAFKLFVSAAAAKLVTAAA